jgi:nitrogen fixation-related uncharacterized protein
MKLKAKFISLITLSVFLVFVTIFAFVFTNVSSHFKDLSVKYSESISAEYAQRS